MKRSIAIRTLPWLLFATLATGAHAAGNKVVIGDIDDMSGVYADVIGPGGVTAAKMAIDDFGGSVLGNKIELLTSDHQNKPDLGAQKFREWADRDGLTMVLGGSNTGVSLAMSNVAKEKKIPFFAIGAAGASLTGKSWFFLTADYAFGYQLQDGASKVVEANGGKVVGSVRVPLATSDFSSYLLQAQNSGAKVLGLANAGNDFTNSIKAADEFGIGRTM